jgi:hypothetical protein
LATITYSGGGAANLTVNQSGQVSGSVSRVRRALQRLETAACD